MNKLTVEQAREVFERSDLDESFCAELIRLLDMYQDVFKIDTPIRRVRFLAQAVHETYVKRDGTVALRENLNYSTKGLMKISKFFRTHKKLALKYGRNRDHKANIRAIANLMYADKNRSRRLRLGNKWAGDGYAFRGMFMFQSTGRYNVMKDIEHIKRMTGIELMDETGKPYEQAVNSYTIFIIGGMAHWHRTKMWELNSTNAVTNKINRGLPKQMKRERLATAVRVKDLLIG